MTDAKKYRLSKQFYLLKSKGVFLSSSEGDSNLYQVGGSGPIVIECFEKNGSLSIDSLHELLRGMFEEYSTSNTDEVKEFVQDLVNSGILEEAK
jgi:hypothetical protein